MTDATAVDAMRSTIATSARRARDLGVAVSRVVVHPSMAPSLGHVLVVDDVGTITVETDPRCPLGICYVMGQADPMELDG